MAGTQDLSNKEQDSTPQGPKNFIQDIIKDDLQQGKRQGVVTRFPPEPNGFLHIGHLKSIVLNFGLAEKFEGRCHLRFDDTNPVAEDQKYIDAIQQDIKWLGFDWGKHLHFASDYFDDLYNFAVQLIRQGQAFVDDCDGDEIRKMRGALTEPGQNSPYRDRSPEENLDLFERMKNGEFEEGSKVLRAKIDMSSPNMNLRDPLLYRIRKVAHHRTGDKWCIYPLYDFTHGLSDMLEEVTHSICTLEFEDHRPLYEWILQELKTPNEPQQIEFARLGLDYTVMSKRVFLQLVEENLVSGWDDPRMPTIRGMRRRGYTPESMRKFAESVGVTKKNSVISLGTLEHFVREDLDQTCARAMAVLDPIKVTLENFADDKIQMVKGPVHPKDESRGEREIPLTKTLYIDRDDFMEDPPKKYFRLKPDGKVRLRYGYVIHCHEVIKDSDGKVVELKCTYDDRTLGGVTPEGEKKVKGIIHWVSADKGIPATVRVYDRLFNDPNPMGKDKDFRDSLNPESLVMRENAFLEPSLASAKPGDRFQFERLGFFIVDQESTDDAVVINRTITLKDTWAKK
ncbi:MAG: glutamine--tRNA ligase/YqeY domain fusion protein [Bdellovibrionales bacterium]|nr:glutamine--tRNA ligase/YqeY domain fusion protein [Bdellovibrionales bacterium]